MKLENVADIYPLAPVQQGLLFHSLFDPGSLTYLNQVACDIEGDFDSKAFCRAWKEVVQRHDMLRTAFFWQGLKEPVQVVRQHVEIPWREEDWSELAPTEQQDQWKSLIDEYAGKQFDFGAAPLMSFALIRRNRKSHSFLWNQHHILLDGWCRQVVIGEVVTLYRAFCEGKPSSLPNPRRYRAYIEWLSVREKGDAESFWREELKGCEPTRLWIEQDRQGKPSQLGQIELRLDRQSTTGCEALARRSRVTLNTVVQGAWAMLISQYSGSKDVIFGATVSGRSAAIEGIESIVGLFINTLPVRVRVSPEEALGPYLRRLQEHHAKARLHEHSSLVDIQSWAGRPRGASLFDHILVFQNYPLDKTLRGGAENGPAFSNIHLRENVHYPMTLTVNCQDELTLSCQYDQAYFDAANIKRFLENLRHLLREMALSAEDEPLGKIDALCEEERTLILNDWNRTASEYPAICIHQLIQQQVLRTPDALALSFQDQAYSYFELNLRANQLGHHLKRLGAGPDIPVGICLDRGPELLIGLLAIMKSGSAYIPLDPHFPDRRLHYMLEHGKAPLLLTHSRHASRFPSYQGKIIQTDTDDSIIAKESKENPVTTSTLDALAYTIYTSGSTGNPKGVMVPHRGLANFLWGVQQVLQMQEGDGLLALTTVSFDIAALELYLPLLVGGCVFLGNSELAADGALLSDALEDESIRWVQATPTTWRILLNSGWRGHDRLHLLCGGEELPKDLAAQLTLCCSQLWNMYGPTETSVWSTVHPVETTATRIELGKPLSNTRVYVLDGEMNPVPVGVSGELFIGGDGVARGYLKRSDLTAANFIPDPFGPLGGRLYRTGDRTRWRGAGTLEFVGRFDQQVKIRGHRIELEEIEIVLRRHPGIEHAVVTVCHNGSGDQRLAAYIVPDPSRQPTRSELREFLKQNLPAYMVPSAFVLVERMPIGPSGKVDRRALPPPDWSDAMTGSVLVPPRNDTEERIAQIWSRVLKVKSVSVEDSFFDLGGHSLLGTQVLSHINQEFQVQLSLRTLFENSTVEELAIRVLEDRAENAYGLTEQILSEIEQIPEDDPQVVSSGQPASNH